MTSGSPEGNAASRDSYLTTRAAAFIGWINCQGENLGGTAVNSDGAGATASLAQTQDNGTSMTRRLAVALIAALALFAFQLAHAQSSSSATGVPCPQTGNGLVATDQRSYL